MQSILCRIHAPSSQSGVELARIAKHCALELKLVFPLQFDRRFARSLSDTEITFSFPIEIAVVCETVWKLASRIACFCPQARVSAEILPPRPLTRSVSGSKESVSEQNAPRFPR